MQRSAGVTATAKHFPGLGDAKTNENTDEMPVTIELPLSQLRLTKHSVSKLSVTTS